MMAIHLLLLTINEVNPLLTGSVHIYLDCLGALDKVKNLPSTHIPAGWLHSDILRNILINCKVLSFDRIYSHVKAHQDDMEEYKNLSIPSQLNCTIDYHAKAVLWNINPTELLKQKSFPLEPVCVFIGDSKVTKDNVDSLRFWAPWKLAKERFEVLHILHHNAFEMVDWKIVNRRLKKAHWKLAKERFEVLHILHHNAFEMVEWEIVNGRLKKVPRLFQLWAHKQVMGIAGTMEWDKSVVWKCPSCTLARDTWVHVLFCCHARRVETLQYTMDLVDNWLDESEMEPELQECLLEYARGRGGFTMEEVCRGCNKEYHQLAIEQDEIGWRRFMEGMICKQAKLI
jgi:hypothetical protein